MRKALFVLPLAAAMMLAGCVNLAPDYERPEAPVAAAWPQDAASKNAVLVTEGLADWAEFFTDERVKKLIALGLENNRDLRTAMHNVEAARAQYRVSRGQLLPSVAAVASESAQRTPRRVSSSGRTVVSHVYSANAAMASYELDLFGRIRNLNEQALQQYFVTEAAQRTAQMTVVTEIARTWLSLGASKQLLKLAQETYQSQAQSKELIERSYEVGSASLMDVEQVTTTVAAAKAAQASALRAVSQQRNALALLVGAPVPSELEPEELPEGITARLSAVSNVPSEVLLGRPDIAAAEARLKSANANIGAARANFFPRIALTGSFGYTSPELSNLFGAGTRGWSWGPSISLPIFTGGQNVANLEAAEQSKKAAVASYEGAIQNAFREVADALAVEGTVTDELKAVEELAAAAKNSYDLSVVRYNSGADSFLEVLVNQRSNFAAQQNLIAARLNRATSAVTLYKVMGGGSKLAAAERAEGAK